MLKYSLKFIADSIASIKYEGLFYYPKDFKRESTLGGEYIKAKEKWNSFQAYEKIPLAKSFFIGKYQIIKTLTESKNEWFIRTNQFVSKSHLLYDFKEKRFICDTSDNMYADLETALEVVYDLQEKEK